MKNTLTVKGMMCMGCVKRVIKALETAGAQDIDVRLPDVAQFEDGGKDLSVFINAIEDVGYDVVK